MKWLWLYYVKNTKELCDIKDSLIYEHRTELRWILVEIWTTGATTTKCEFHIMLLLCNTFYRLYTGSNGQKVHRTELVTLSRQPCPVIWYFPKNWLVPTVSPVYKSVYSFIYDVLQWRVGNTRFSYLIK